MTATSKTTGAILLAAGGTGGHMFPAEALARALIDRGRRVILVTDRRGRGFGDRLPAVEVFASRRRGLPAAACCAAPRASRSSCGGYLQARRLVIRLRPALVVGFGGYASVPTVYAAQRAGLPTLLHEQNAVLGRANRMLAAQAAGRRHLLPRDRGAGQGHAAPHRQSRAPGDRRPRRAALSGHGRHASAAGAGRQPGRSSLRPADSRGARSAGRRSGAGGSPSPSNAGPRIWSRCAAPMRALGQPAELADFFTDVAERLAIAHLVISRSGASTVAELAAAGRPAILLPYPHATDDHQTANAAAFAGAGAGWLMPEANASPESLAQHLAMLLDDPAALSEAAAAAHNFGRGDAAVRLADLAEALIPANGGHPAEVAA